MFLTKFKNNITENEAEVKNVEYWRELNNRMVNEVQSHIDDLEFVTDVNVKRIAVNLERRLKDLLDDVLEDVLEDLSVKICSTTKLAISLGFFLRIFANFIAKLAW